MSQHGQGALGARQRVRLTVALIVLSALAAISALGIGITLHDRAETLDSLAHWRARSNEAGADPGLRLAIGHDSPALRIRRLEAHLDAMPERLFAMGAVFVLATVLLVLGYRALRADRRVT